MSSARYSRVSKYTANRELQAALLFPFHTQEGPGKVVKFLAKLSWGP